MPVEFSEKSKEIEIFSLTDKEFQLTCTIGIKEDIGILIKAHLLPLSLV